MAQRPTDLDHAQLARLLHRLGWCAWLGVLVPPSMPVVALVASLTMILLTHLTGPGGHRSWWSAAGVLAGAACGASLCGWFVGEDEPVEVVAAMLGSGAFSAYALGLASWTETFRTSRIASRLRLGVVMWWLGVASVATTYALSDPASSERVEQRGSFIGDRVLSGAASVPAFVALVCFAAAYWFVCRYHFVVRRSLAEFAEERAAAGGARDVTPV